MTNKRILTLITLLLFLLLVVGCDVIKPNQPPEITSVPVKTATVGVDYTYNVVATDPNAGDVLTYSLTTEPLGMLINATSGVITWIPDAVGDLDVVVVVSDEGGLSDSQDFTIEVSEFVKELIGIEVDPEEMTLPLDAMGTFEVTANYNDGTDKDVTSDCVYGIDDISIAEVHKEESKVLTLEVGTATISISYTEEDITKVTTLTIIVGDTITISWGEAAVRYFPDGTVKDSWLDTEDYEADLIKVDGGYCFADIDEYYNWHMYPEMGLEGSIVIDETGALSGWATYTTLELDTRNDFVGQVEIIIYEEEPNGNSIDGTMVGTYTQWKYVYAESDDELVLLEDNYLKAVLAPEQGPGWWFTSYTEYTAYEE